MQIKVRVRVNDIHNERKTHQLAHSGFILYDHCSEVKFGEKQTVSLEEFRAITYQWHTIAEIRKNRIYNVHPETNETIDNLVYMVRDIEATEERIKRSKEVGKNDSQDYHFNVIEWVDRLTNKRYRLIFDTIVWLMDDNGNNLRKIEG